eukprot:scaffold101376_cov28-Tisochrysis_lutea.AAC.2
MGAAPSGDHTEALAVLPSAAAQRGVRVKLGAGARDLAVGGGAPERARAILSKGVEGGAAAKLLLVRAELCPYGGELLLHLTLLDTERRHLRGPGAEGRRDLLAHAGGPPPAARRPNARQVGAALGPAATGLRGEWAHLRLQRVDNRHPLLALAGHHEPVASCGAVRGKRGRRLAARAGRHRTEHSGGVCELRLTPPPRDICIGLLGHGHEGGGVSGRHGRCLSRLGRTVYACGRWAVEARRDHHLSGRQGGAV